MKKYFKRIKQWNERSGTIVHDTFNLPTIQDRELVTTLLNEEVQELEESETKDDVLDAFADIEFLLIGAMARYGITFEEVSEKLRQVVNSNETKFCKTEHEAIRSIEKEAYRLNLPIDDVKYIEIDGVFVIYNARTGKTLKGINYQEPSEFKK